MDAFTMKELKSFWYLESRGSGTEEEWTAPIKSTPFILGRTEDNDLVLRAKSVSRHHAEINLSGELLWIRDLKSTNGTYVNTLSPIPIGSTIIPLTPSSSPGPPSFTVNVIV